MKLLKYYIALIIVFTSLMNSCTFGGRSELLFTDNNKIADETFHQFLQAIKLEDASHIKSLFSSTAQNEQGNIDEEALKLIEFIKGNIVSYTSAEESGVSADYEKDNGKSKKMIQPSFCIETTESKYYVAIKECIIDEFESNNVGVMSIYIIEAKNWNQDYVYRGDGKWTYGINIIDY